MSDIVKVTPDMIEGYIRKVEFLNIGDALGNPDLKVLTMCFITLKNGFVVTGQSACANPSMYNKDIGEAIARKNAVESIWPLMGYALRNKIAGMDGLIEKEGNYIDRMREEKALLDEKRVKAGKALRDGILNEFNHDLLSDQLRLMDEYSRILSMRIGRAEKDQATFS